MCLKETAVDRKKGESKRKKIYLCKRRDNKGYDDCEKLRERKEQRTTWHGDKSWVCVCVHLCYTYIYTYVCVCVCVFILRQHVCRMKAAPVVLLQDNVCQAPSIWHVFDVEIQGAKAQAASVQSPAGHIHHCACACAHMCVWVCVRETGRGGWKRNTESHKPQQAAKVNHGLSVFNYPPRREATVVAQAFPPLKAVDSQWNQYYLNAVLISRIISTCLLLLNWHINIWLAFLARTCCRSSFPVFSSAL